MATVNENDAKHLFGAKICVIMAGENVEATGEDGFPMDTRNMDVMKICYFAGMILAFADAWVYYRRGDLTGTAAWSLLGLLCLVLCCRRMIRGRYLNMRLRRVDRLSGDGFENYLRAHFSRLGYKVKMTEASHDYGADLLLKKWGEVIVVQAKRYEKNVGVAAVQEAIGAVAYYDADRAIVVTNNGFTKSACLLADRNDVELWGRQELKDRFGAKE